ncbi:hypothetical protein [Bradyrhizobium sp.]|uniref:hypothetical protein n=1 Tax=Bradyrhizobium sp. TaxID=376 RepID=UPI00238E6B07|nr:hypothetical protein [Bradyrhizobium sp.]MDE2378406.1 hypothetical protein [Bradyrhizobium sp.]
MIIPTHLGPASPLWRAPALLQTWALGRLSSVDLTVADLRLALIALVMRSLLQAANAIVRAFMGRAWQGARFAQDITAAATMLAAAWR